MAPPALKRRRLNDTDGVNKPFKSPFRTPLKKHPDARQHGTETAPRQTPRFAASAEQDQTPIPSSSSMAQISPSFTPSPTVKRTPYRLVPSSRPGTDRKTLALATQISEMRQAISTLQQAADLLASDKDDRLEALIAKWRAASRAAAEDLFEMSSERVKNMGGMGGLREKAKEQMEYRSSWDDGVGDCKEFTEDVSESVEEHDDDADESFTMDVMLTTLNIDLDVIGYSRITQQWED